ncbi:hypothetical protein N5O88_10115 [Pseudomonas sp. GD03721]|nr:MULTISPECIES: hypothetical protein [unclassified Pseudomonas]MDH1440380.1 hypothetical protein [Pseudomonas sp. GD03722]WGG03531.1 hypothetical protein N5O88_10115 [Pseudomonas sp. GD03721]WGG07699.1 hypothetical protein N5O87_10125 [Pseudomonas sp. GD03919]
MKAWLMVLLIGVLTPSLVWSQSSDEDAGLPEQSTPLAMEEEVQPLVSIPVHEFEALQQDLAAVLQVTRQIAEVQEREGSLLLKVRDGVLVNMVWEIFGFGGAGKSAVGYAISLIGIAGVFMKAAWFVLKDGKPEPSWARGLTYAYLVLVVAVFSTLVFSGGVVSAGPAPSASAKPLLEAADRLERTVESRLQALDRKLEDLQAPSVSAGSSLDPLAAEALLTIQRDLERVSSLVDSTEKQAAEAASRSTGWGWHLLIVVLLLAVLLLQFLFLLAHLYREKERR